MVVVLIVGVLVLTGIAILCFAAYKIKAESFEFTTAILKLVSFSIKIVSSDAERGPRGPNKRKPGSAT